ncbi:MAG: GH25 family lysozyme [Anaerobutyricum hallii]|uniref:GH25 family lysozyme n=1 Tax=Anaerobutyricum hallii TaxID=39488 RepID=UPI002E76D906|nr:GH25 family lysozyme [Anaerobutyricum hallii]MEE1485310.1 GH25 family lysozyme [Anaerobutyricum hallii]
MRKLIDVSSYNGVVDWKKAKSYGCQGAILKIIRKDLNRDKKFNENFAVCNKNKIGWGVYNYSYATTATKAKSDMELVCDILDKIDKTHFVYGVWFDIEDKVQASLSKAKIAAIINAAQQVVEERGYLFGVYTGMSYYNEHIDRKLVKCNNWWIARYYRGDARMQIATNPNEKYKPTTANIAWQYTSSGRFPKVISTGNSGNFDLNVLYKEPVAKKVEEDTKKPVKKKIVYYPRYKGKSSSIVDALKSLSINPSKSNRKRIATLNGVKNYTGSAMQNTRLLNLLKKGKLIKSK